MRSGKCVSKTLSPNTEFQMRVLFPDFISQSGYIVGWHCAIILSMELCSIPEPEEIMAKKKIKVEMELPAPPEGYEYTGEYGLPREGDLYLNCDTTVRTADRDWKASSYPILRKAIKYREPVLPQDLGKAVEFSDPGSVWVTSRLSGYSAHFTGRYWVECNGLRFGQARIRDDS